MNRSHVGRSSFVDTRSLVFWVGLGLTVFGASHILPLVLRDLSRYPGPGMLAAVLWTVYALVLAFILYRLELFERRSPMTMLGAFVWGAVVVAGIGTVASPVMYDLVGKILGPDLEDWISAFSAPLVEEPLKMLGVVALAFIPGARIDSALDGLFYGLIVGLGFEVTESFLYTTQAGAQQGGDVTIIVLTFILRGIIGGLWNHPTYTGITGAGVGYFFGSKEPALRRWLVMVGCLLAAMVLHGFFNSPLVENGNPVVSSIVKGLPVLILLIVLLRVARRREMAMFERVSDTSVPSDLVADDEVETLLRKSTRRKARRDIRREHGLAASRALKRLQRAQIDLVEAVAHTGADSDAVEEAAALVREDREVLARATSR